MKREDLDDSFIGDLKYTIYAYKENKLLLDNVPFYELVIRQYCHNETIHTINKEGFFIHELLPSGHKGDLIMSIDEVPQSSRYGYNYLGNTMFGYDPSFNFEIQRKLDDDDYEDTYLIQGRSLMHNIAEYFTGAPEFTAEHVPQEQILKDLEFALKFKAEFDPLCGGTTTIQIPQMDKFSPEMLSGFRMLRT